jgi:hypothetical protein
VIAASAVGVLLLWRVQQQPMKNCHAAIVQLLLLDSYVQAALCVAVNVYSWQCGTNSSSVALCARALVVTATLQLGLQALLPICKCYCTVKHAACSVLCSYTRQRPGHSV